MSPSAIPLPTTTQLTADAIESELAAAPTKPQLDASLLTYTFADKLKPVAAQDDPIRWSQNCTSDHMVLVKWTEDGGWEAPVLKPYGPLELYPTASVLHYATEAFEGMKCYRGSDGKLRIFRPNLNCKRMNMSATRAALPSFPAEELQKLIMALLSVDGPRWVPDENTFMYIRPTIIASGAALGVQKPREATIFIIACLFPKLDQGPGMRLLASADDMIRAWPGGFGYAKIGANYGPSLMAQGEARARGYHQILWLFDAKYVTEAGASNFFVVWRSKETGNVELITAPLDDKIILDGVTRRSVLELARSRLTAGGTDKRDVSSHLNEIKVVERKFTIQEIIDAQKEGRLIEAFAAGTAFFIAPVSVIHFKGIDYDVPLETVNDDKAKSGHYAKVFRTWLKDIMYGREDHEWGVVVPEAGIKH